MLDSGLADSLKQFHDEQDNAPTANEICALPHTPVFASRLAPVAHLDTQVVLSISWVESLHPVKFRKELQSFCDVDGKQLEIAPFQTQS